MVRTLVGEAKKAERTQGAEALAGFDVIVRTFEAPISRYLYGMVGDLELARDLTQDTFLSAYRALPGTEITNLSGWLYRIATNHALTHFRRKKLVRWVSLSRLVEIGRDPSTGDHGERVATDRSVEDALSALAPKDRACLLLKAAGFSSQEIADHLGCSEGAARTRLARAREAFRRAYHKDSIDDAEGR